jgi:hypothetical protein
MRCHLPPVIVAISKKASITDADEGVKKGRGGTLSSIDGKVN